MSRVLITGGTKGIGLAAVKRFLADGDTVIVAARNTEGLPKQTIALPYDLSDPAAVQILCREAGNIDILVNNAGILMGKPFDGYTDDDRNYILQLNLLAPVTLATYFGKQMAEQGGGRIVNVASQAALVGNPDIWYGMTKAALVNLTKSLAGLLGGQGVVVNAVSPGPVTTEMVAGSPYGERFEKIRKRTYLGRFAETKEIADMIYMLAKQSPDYLNGENIVINNGALTLEMK